MSADDRGAHNDAFKCMGLICIIEYSVSVLGDQDEG